MMAVALDHVKEARILATANPELVVIPDDNGIYRTLQCPTMGAIFF